METIKPDKLSTGDLVGIVAPSHAIWHRLPLFEKARKSFEKALGVKTILSKHAKGKYYYTSGTKQERVDDIHDLIADKEVKAVVMALGGDTAIDLVDKLDYELIKNNPKIIAGISDATTLIHPITQKTGLVTFLGLEFLEFGKREMSYEVEYLRKAWFEGEIGEVQPNSDWYDFYDIPTNYDGWKMIKKGKVSGRLFGGNYGSMAMIVGSKYAGDLTDSIFLFEAYKYHKSRIHRALSHLRLHDVFDQIGGLIVGYLVGSDDPVDIRDNRDLKDLVLEVTDGFDIPIMQVGEFGHYVENAIMPIGAKATMDATNLKLSVDETVTI